MKLVGLLVLLGALVGLGMVEAKIPNPYKILGISQSANDNEIKKAFKRRSLKYHPDRNTADPNANDKYAKVVNAYELLKDAEKRRMYDMTGDVNPQTQGGGGFNFPGGAGGFGINIEDLMRMGMGGMGGGQQRQQGQRQYTFNFGGGEGFRF